MSNPTTELEAARALRARLEALHAPGPAPLALPDAVVDALLEHGLMRLLLPRSLGGRQLDPVRFLEVVEELARGDGSAGWVVSQVCVFSIQALNLRPDVAGRVFGDPRALVANGQPIDARADVVDGGFRVSGQFAFSSGCHHATWLAGGAVVHQDGQRRSLRPGLPELRYMFFRREEVELLDGWDVSGLRATGSNRFAVSDRFVPAELTAPAAISSGPSHGPSYAISSILYFALGLGAVGTGIARCALDAFKRMARERTLAGASAPLGTHPIAQHHLAQAEAVLRSARAFLFDTVAEAWASIQATGQVTLEQRALLRLASTHAMQESARAVDLVYQVSGSSSIFAGHPLQRCFQDIHVLTQHIQGRPALLGAVGQVLLGLPCDEPFI